MTYTHMTSKERDRLAVWRGRGLSLRDISERLGRSIGTLSRELHRNRARTGYFAQHAQDQSDKRLTTGHKRMRLKSRVLRYEVEQMLVKGWSPEIIAGRIPGHRKDLLSISPEAIYQWIYSERPDLIGCLVRAHPKRWPRRHRKYAPRPGIPRRVPLTERSPAANDRQEIGHWETDLVVGPGLAALQVSVERQTRYTQLRKVAQKTAPLCRAALTDVLAPLPEKLRRSITYDNGSENYEHTVLNEDLGMSSYFCQPYHSWEKGTVENTNGLVRRLVPKRTPLGPITPQRFQEIENWLNDRPRKCLKFQTPREAFTAACCT
jgi:IS30 family transposase